MIINVKAATTRYGLSRFWTSKIHSHTTLHTFYAIFLNNIFTTFFTSFNIISCGITYDYAVLHFSPFGLKIDIFLQDSINEELNYISRSKDSKFFNFLFPFVQSSNLLLTAKLLKFFTNSSKKITQKKFNTSNSILHKSKTRKLFNRSTTHTAITKLNRLTKYVKKKIYYFWLYKFNINLHQNEFKTFSMFSSKTIITKIFRLNYPNTFKKAFRSNLAFLFFFFQKYFKRNYLFNFVKKSNHFSGFSDPIIKFITSNNRCSTIQITKLRNNANFFVKINSSQYSFFFNNHKFSKKFFSSKFFKTTYRKIRIKYFRRRQKSKNFFFSPTFASFFALFQFYSKILKIYLLPFFPILNIRIYRLKYTNINVNAFVFYSAVKLYYKYMLNDIIRPLIRGASRYYTGFFVLCKGRFTRAQIASKRVYRRSFINYNRMQYPIYYAIKSVALRYGSSTVHIWIQH
jgi:hypothetical protein